jgi:hypothetical protein
MTFQEIRLLFLKRREEPHLRLVPPQDGRHLRLVQSESSYKARVMCVTFKSRVEAMRRV